MRTNILMVFAVVVVTLSTLVTTSCNKTRGNIETTSTAYLAIPKLIDRAVSTGTETEYEELHTRFDNAVIAIEKNPDDIKQYLTIASVYIAEARITGNTTYYNDAALRMLNFVIDRSAGNTENLYLALSMKSGVLMSLHQFTKALESANTALALNNRNATVYGALTDAYVELGQYDNAVKMCDAMLSLKPDIRSYARASYIRQIFGDNAGAKDAMEMAVNAGVPGMENTEWARVTLADIYVATGDLNEAKAIYNMSLELRADYAPAIVGLANVAMLNGEYTNAIQLLEKAIGISSEAHYVSMLADAYLLSGDKEKSEKIHADVLKLLLESEKEQKDLIVQHNGARELAEAYMHVGDYTNALRYAKTDLEMRPENIDANALAAWICFKQKNYAQAKQYADKMMATNVQNNNYLYKASLIYKANGDATQAEESMAAAKQISPWFDKTIAIQ